MDLWQSLLWLGGGLLAVLLVSLLPAKMGKLLLFAGFNALSGLAVLAVINLLAGYTSLFLPLNGLTVAISSVLGVPGVAALAVLAAV